MKALTSCLFAASLLAGAIAVASANAQPASPGLSTATQPTDVSTAKRKPRAAAVAVAPLYGPPPGSTWRGPDPSYGPGTAQLREYQRQGVCVIDEGYGRFTFCSNR